MFKQFVSAAIVALVLVPATASPALPTPDDVKGLKVTVASHRHINNSSDRVDVLMELDAVAAGQDANSRWDLTILVNGIKKCEVKNVTGKYSGTIGTDYATQFHQEGEVTSVVLIAVCRTAPVFLIASEGVEHD